jgi:hypothetical protein
MCCFSQPVLRVSGTRVFARSAEGALQYLVYSMNLQAAGDLAMLLPLPVPPRSREDAVRFVSLEHYADFFDDLEAPFRPPPTRALMGAPQAAPLKVHDVGAYEASFVPALADFARLDARFRLPESTWGALPAYRDYGFAVFKLKSPSPTPGLLGRLLRRAPQRTFHPMAFLFPRRDPATLFFPTLHIHDGRAHERAAFDHVLYCQADRDIESALADWRSSTGPVKGYTRGNDALGILDLDAPVWRLGLTGMRKNQDIVLGGTHAEAV